VIEQSLFALFLAEILARREFHTDLLEPFLQVFVQLVEHIVGFSHGQDCAISGTGRMTMPAGVSGLRRASALPAVTGWAAGSAWRAGILGGEPSRLLATLEPDGSPGVP
jgi:hypothetical protein